MKLDIGCGKAKKAGFTGCDIKPFEGVDVVLNAGKDRWPWEDGSVEEIYTSHFFEHLTPEERIHAVNEACRVLQREGTLTIITPHWASPRAFGDLTHVWPPVSEWWPYYLDKTWREQNAPHEDRYTCDFFYTSAGYSPNVDLSIRSQEFQQFALRYYKGAADDMVAVLKKK